VVALERQNLTFAIWNPLVLFVQEILCTFFGICI
jgi:hypothetical protein